MTAEPQAATSDQLRQARRLGEAVELLTGAAVERVRECDAADCALLFWDTSRPGRRRWCSDGACGSKSRSAAYRARLAVGVS